MKIRLACPRCSRTNLNAERYAVGYRDDGRYNIPCGQQHRDILVLQQQKFEILFDIGANAILDGYFRDAVSSFTASLERVYEFYVMSAFFEKGLHVASKQMWKSVSNMSERQLGAFIMVFTLENGVPPSLLSNKDVQFRNEVIHKGKIPTHEESLMYGQGVLDVVRPIIRAAQEQFPNGVRDTMIQHIASCRRPEDPQDLFAGHCANTILNLSITGEEWHQRTMIEALSDLAQIRHL
jgi:hypothetical protein